LHGWENVEVGVQRDPDPGVAEPFGDDLGVHPSQEERS
jgi:hypothetical protein